MTYSDRYFNSNYNETTSKTNKNYDPTLCNWCQKNKATTNYMGVQVCQECKFNKLDNESVGEKYDRYTSMGISHEDAVADTYGEEP